MKSLISVFITQDKYLSLENIPNDIVPSKEQTTVLTSVPNRPGCPYLSWQQVSPPNRASNGLSWVIYPNLGMEVIQFLTCQLTFRIKWTVTNPTTETNGRLVFLLPVSSFEAYEAPDINGNKICIPCKTGTGCFKVPG